MRREFSRLDTSWASDMKLQDERKQIEFSIGYVLKLAEAGKTLDQVERFKLSKKAAADDFSKRLDEYLSIGRWQDPAIARNLFEAIYSKTRGKIRKEIGKSKAGRKTVTWQGFKNPITGKKRFPLSLGSKKTNIDNSTMTPAQANFVSLLSKEKKIKNFKNLQKRYRNRSSDTEFINDPMTFNSRAGRLTEAGKRDFKKAFKYVHGYEIDDDYMEALTDRLFGTHAGFDESPFIFRR